MQSHTHTRTQRLCDRNSSCGGDGNVEDGDGIGCLPLLQRRLAIPAVAMGMGITTETAATMVCDFKPLSLSLSEWFRDPRGGWKVGGDGGRLVGG